MIKTDWTLLAINAAGSRGLSPVQLQKALFLLGREARDLTKVADWYDFKPYNYGPFDRNVYDDAARLEARGEVEIIQRPGENWNRFTATRDGDIRASYLAREAPEGVEYLARLVDWVRAQSFQGLVKAIYARYPEMRENSVFQG